MFASLLVIISSLLSVNAFSSVRSAPSSSTKLYMADKMVGASVELGNQIYDPLDMLKLHDIAPTVFPHPKWLRESELKHCRIAMLASIGAFSAQWGLVIPGYTANPDPVTNLNQFVLDWPTGFSQILITIAVVEGASNPTEFWFGKGDREAGAWSFDPTKFYAGLTQAKKDDLTLKELKNGRLAMMAMAAYTAEHWIPGSVPFLPGKF